MKTMLVIEVDELIRVIENAVEVAVVKAIKRLQSNQQKEQSKYYDTKELCALLKIDRITVWSWEKKGILKPTMAGRRKLYDRAEIDAALSQGKLGRYCHKKE